MNLYHKCFIRMVFYVYSISHSFIHASYQTCSCFCCYEKSFLRSVFNFMTTFYCVIWSKDKVNEPWNFSISATSKEERNVLRPSVVGNVNRLIDSCHILYTTYSSAFCKWNVWSNEKWYIKWNNGMNEYGNARSLQHVFSFSL